MARSAAVNITIVTVVSMFDLVARALGSFYGLGWHWACGTWCLVIVTFVMVTMMFRLSSS